VVGCIKQVAKLWWAYPGLAVWRAVCRRTLRRYRRRLRHGPATNAATLRRILSAAAETTTGRQFGFAEILAAPDPEQAFRERLPLRDYASHAESIQAIARGDADVLFAGRPGMFVATSGTSNDPKLLPTTALQQNSALEHIALLAPALRWEVAPQLRLNQRSINLMLASDPANAMPGGVPLGMSSAGGLRKVLRAAPFIWTSPAAVFELREHAMALYLHALFGLRDRDAGCIEAIFGTHILSWMNMVMSRRDELVADLREGRISADLPLPPAVRATLEAQLSPEPERAAEVAAAFAAGEAGLLQRLWPELRVLSTVVSGAFAVSLPRLRWLAGPDIKICASSFGATESMVGVNMWPDQPDRYALAVGSGYFEFLPVQAVHAVQPQALAIDAVVVGECYELVVTTFAGLYRYRLGDIVRVSDEIAGTPVFEFDHRLGDVLDLVGEKTTEKHTQQVVAELARQGLGAASAISNYTVVADCTAAGLRYRVFIELAAADAGHAAGPELAVLFDELLQVVNPSYRTLARANGRLAQADVQLVAPGSFAALEDRRYQQAAGVSRNQVKVPRVLKDVAQIELLEAAVLRSTA
jgi:hypothetical protein